MINLIPKANTYHPKKKMIQRHFYWHGERWVLVVKRRCTRRQKVVSTSYKVARVMQASTTFFLFSQRLNCLSTNVIIAKKNHWKSTKKKTLEANFIFLDSKGILIIPFCVLFFLFIQISNCPLSFLITEKKSLWKDGKSHWGWFYFFFCFQRHFSIFICLKKLNKKIFKHSDNILMINESFKKI